MTEMSAKHLFSFNLKNCELIELFLLVKNKFKDFKLIGFHSPIEYSICIFIEFNVIVLH